MGIEAMLIKFGCRIVGLASGADQALETARRESIDLAILDVKLDQKSVYPVARELAARAIPFIFMTGYTRTDIPEALKAVPYLEKPFGEDELRERLERLFP